MARIQWTDIANEALASIVLHRRQQVGFVAARALRQRITRQVYLLRDFPQLGRRASENESLRELIVSPYLISYRIIGDRVVILDVFHARATYADEGEGESEP